MVTTLFVGFEIVHMMFCVKTTTYSLVHLTLDILIIIWRNHNGSMCILYLAGAMVNIFLWF